MAWVGLPGTGWVESTKRGQELFTLLSSFHTAELVIWGGKAWLPFSSESQGTSRAVPSPSFPSFYVKLTIFKRILRRVVYFLYSLRSYFKLRPILNHDSVTNSSLLAIFHWLTKSFRKKVPWFVGDLDLLGRVNWPNITLDWLALGFEFYLRMDF